MRPSITERRADPEKVMRKVWHRIGTQVKIEWRSLLTEILSKKISLMDAHASMAFLFGLEGVVWELVDTRIQVPHARLAHHD